MPVDIRIEAVSTVLRLVVTVVAGALLAACSGERGDGDSQVAVRVNAGEISVHQVQAVLQRQPRLLATANEAAAGQMLEVLIDQELAAQAARDQGLESEPGFIQASQAARRELLARAYHDRIAAKATMPSSDEIGRYYDSQPALFAQRRLYILQESAVEASGEEMARLQDIVSSAKGSDALSVALRDAGLRSSSRQFAQAAEDLPLQLLEALSKASVGQSVMFPQAGGARIFTVLQAHLAPVDRRTATDAIASFLVTERKRRLVADAVKQLRDGADLAYQGIFAKPMVAAATAQPAPAAASSALH